MLIRICFGLLFSAAALQTLAASDCNQLKGCDKKFCEIEKQLVIAREQNNRNKISGLTQSLENAKANCTNTALKDDLTKKIHDAKADLAEYESDRKEAEKEGKVKKALKYQNKIDKKNIEIKSLESELSNLR